MSRGDGWLLPGVGSQGEPGSEPRSSHGSEGHGEEDTERRQRWGRSRERDGDREEAGPRGLPACLPVPRARSVSNFLQMGLTLFCHHEENMPGWPAGFRGRGATESSGTSLQSGDGPPAGLARHE